MRTSGVCLAFFFQAEDGIRDSPVTGVQTCALPIYATQIDIRRMRATIIFITLFPILLLFPLILKYFTKGINLGGIKE